MPDPDAMPGAAKATKPATDAANAYKAATDAYIQSQNAAAKNQIAQGMATAKMADQAAAPDPLAPIYAKVQNGTATPAEQKQLNDEMAKRNGQPIATPAAPPVKAASVAAPAQPAPTPASQPLGVTLKQAVNGTITDAGQKQLYVAGVPPAAPPPPAIPADEASRKARWSALDAKRKASSLTRDEIAEYIALGRAAPENQPGYGRTITDAEAAKFMADARAHGAIGSLSPEASIASMANGGGPVYRDFPTNGLAASPATSSPATSSLATSSLAPSPAAPPVAAPSTSAKKSSTVDDIIASMKNETSKDGGPNVWDIIQAAAAGWNMQTPAYLERKRTQEAKAADLEKLSKTAQFEKALQEERLAAEDTRTNKEIAAREALARMQAGQGIGTVPGVTKGQQLSANLLQGLRGK